MTPLWTAWDEALAVALGELMADYMADHPGVTEDEAFDAVVWKTNRRAREIMADRPQPIITTETHHVPAHA